MSDEGADATVMMGGRGSRGWEGDGRRVPRGLAMGWPTSWGRFARAYWRIAKRSDFCCASREVRADHHPPTAGNDARLARSGILRCTQQYAPAVIMLPW